MISTTDFPESTDVISRHPDQILFREDFKYFVLQLVALTSIVQKFKPRLYSYVDYIIARFYAIIVSKSQHHACEILNNLRWEYAIKNGLRVPYQFNDRMRSRRLIPHQTQVDKFFRLMNEEDIKTLFGGMLDYINQEILKEYVPNRTWAVIADNTKDPYYGAKDPKYHIKTPHLPGTKVAWLTQGISIKSKDIHLYADFHTIIKGVYRCLHIPETIDWLKWLKVKISRLLVDREFYRAALVKDTYDQGVLILMPTKKYKWVKHRMTQYLLGKAGITSGTPFMQSFKQYPHQKGSFVRLVLIGHNGRGAWEVRDDYRKGKLSFDQALAQLAGFYTNLKPWKNKRRWSKWLMKEYKRRWCIETGFSNLNLWHIRFRTRTFTGILAEKYMNACLYNLWQAEKKYCIENGVFPRDRTLEVFREKLKCRLVNLMLDLMN